MEMLNGIQQDNHMNNAELASLLKHASCGICTFRLKTGEPSEMLYMTDGYCVICDGTKEEIFAAYKADRLFGVAKEYHEQMNQMIIDTVLTNELHELTYQSVTLRGEKRWCKIALSPQKREDGETILYATFTDVTKQMEIQRNLDDLIHNIPGAVCLFRFNGTYLEPVVISERYSEMLGTDARAELNNMRDLNFTHVHPDDLEMVKKEVYEALVSSGKANCTYRSYNEKKKDYIWINIQGNAIKQEDGTVYAYALYTDITKDKEVEQKLRADELIMESAAENAGVWYWNCHWRQNLAYMSKKFQDEFGLPATLSDFAKTMFT